MKCEGHSLPCSSESYRMNLTLAKLIDGASFTTEFLISHSSFFIIPRHRSTELLLSGSFVHGVTTQKPST